jgi:large subunit ribosomal protein L17
MRHRKATLKLGRTSSHLNAMLANLVSSLIKEKRVRTTLQKAKAARRLAEKLVTMGKRGTLADRRRAASILGSKDPVVGLFGAVAPAFKDRNGGYTRIVKLGRRSSDSAEVALLEWVNYVPPPPKKKKKAEDKAAAGTAGGKPSSAPAKESEATAKT